MIRRSMGLFGLGLGIWIVACSDSNSGGAASTPDAACDQLVSAICNKLSECFPIAITASYKDVNDCIARQKQTCLTSANAPSTGATPGYVSGCASAYQSASCDTIIGGDLDACKTPAGSLADGAACGDGAQCQGRRCNKKADSQCGACATRVAAGGDCEASGDCVEGLRCAQNGKCVEPAKAGAACGENQPCAAPLACSKGTCAQPAAAGASCANGEACDSLKGLFCDPGSKTCKEVKFAKAGESCGLVNGTFVGCAEGGDCKTGGGQTTGTCQAALADGASCTADGPGCKAPAECINGVCTLADPGACK